ncbi:MAG: aminotransferase [Cytophagaceae bacterium]|nr:aminotransferase [Cytophagaceae bacterium]|tara:strand:- start:10350 stop:10835 length:486 start_codon:yes stop_codon:yes gene_type:complete
MRTIQSSSIKSDFKLLHDGHEVTRLNYTSWFTGKAEALLNGQKIWLAPKNIWASRARMYKDDRVIGDITSTLKGFMVIRLEQDGVEKNYVLKNVGRLKLQLEVYNEQEVLQFSLATQRKWTKLNYDYTIEMGNFDAAVELDELLLYCGYAANLYLAVISAA